MAKIPLVGGYSLMKEGIYVFRIKSCDYKENLGKLRYILERDDGKTIINDFNFGADGQNLGGLKSFSIFARKALGNTTTDEVDPEELVGKYVRAEVYHNESNIIKDDGTYKMYANLRNFESADGFETMKEVLPDVDLDDILGI